MVKALLLGLFAVTMCGIACAAPKPQLDLPVEEMPPSQPPIEDPAARSERSTNLSHVTGTARKIWMYLNHRQLQILPGGIVNGTTDETSVYTILQRTTIGIGQMKIQGVATCQYLCMNSRGLLYGSREFCDECIFNETIEQNNYNTYSSTKYSNDNRTLYLGLNKRGQPRKVLLRGRQRLAKLSSCTRVLTKSVPAEMAEGLHLVRHHAHLCSIAASPRLTNSPVDPPRCRKKKKRKKKKRKFYDGDIESELYQKKTTTNRKLHNNNNKLAKKCDNEDSDECQREVTINKNNNNNNNNSNNNNNNNNKKQKSDRLLNKNKKKPKKSGKKVKHQVPFTTTTELSIGTDYVTPDEDYGSESTTHWEWEDSTSIPENMSMSLSSVSAQPD